MPRSSNSRACLCTAIFVMWRCSARVWRSDWPSRLRMRRISRFVDPKTGESTGGSGKGAPIGTSLAFSLFQLVGLQSCESLPLSHPCVDCATQRGHSVRPASGFTHRGPAPSKYPSYSKPETCSGITLENTISQAKIAQTVRNKPLSQIQAREFGSLDNHEQNPLKSLAS